MVGLLKAAGGLLIVFAILAAVTMFFMGGTAGLFAVLSGAVSAAFGGILTIAFGSMLEHLETISRHSPGQTELLNELLRQGAKESSPHRDSIKTPKPSLEQLSKSNFIFKEI
ncbi:hypothetical protein RHSP_63209 [Rhizobium freirei PRF 81]|uniref:Transmembrane protein n=1 Tax=Rhizobium freirei PRF 81 TaxID=363754 RepID=N6U4S4_9HYPH|nr:hypothetical protein [Rhizobium freirei]ENN87599.1 hypothetical protein RHSP_63209 [Rhizobium freirei PRF 81]